MIQPLVITFPQGIQVYVINCGHSGIFAKQQNIMNSRQVCLRLHQSITSVHQDEHAQHSLTGTFHHNAVCFNTNKKCADKEIRLLSW